MIIGATGTIGNEVRKRILTETDWEITLLVRNPTKIGKSNAARETIIESDVDHFNKNQLTDIDAVFVALSGNMPELTKKIVNVLESSETKRLVQILTMGIYNEVPAKYLHGGGMSDYVIRYAEAGEIIENSDLDYTIIRPAWFDHGDDEVNVTKKGEMLTGHDVSVTAISKFVVKALAEPDFAKRQSFGLNRPD